MDQLKIIKSEIVSIITSSGRNSIPVEMLMRDYENCMGRPLPFREFGCAGVIDLLMLMQDTLSIREEKGLFMVQVYSNKSSHIKNLVSGQKKNKSYHRRFPVRNYRGYYPTNTAYKKVNSIPPSVKSPSPKEPKNVISKPIENIKVPPPKPKVNNEPLIQKAPIVNIKVPPPKPKVNDKPLIQKTPIVNIKVPPKPKVNDELLIQKTPIAPKEVYLTSYNQNINHKKEATVEISPISRRTPPETSSTKSQIQKSEKSSIINSSIKDYFDKFRQILKIHPEGINISDFHIEYEARYKERFDPSKFGFASLETTVLSSPDIFSYKKTSDSKLVLFEATNFKIKRETWIPSLVLDSLALISQEHPEGLDGDTILQIYKERFGYELNIKILGFETVEDFLKKCPSIKVITDDQFTVYPKNWGKKQIIESNVLPITNDYINEIWKKYFDDDVCGPDDKYKKMELTKLKFPLIKIVICDVYAPDKFWIHTDDTIKDLIRLMFDLRDFYDEHGDKYVLDDVLVRENMVCVTKWQGKWHRAKINKKTSKDVVEVTFVDYGTVSSIAIKEIRVLHKKFFKNPMYAICSSLHGIIPIDQELGYTPESCDFLTTKYLGKCLYAIVNGVSSTEPYLHLILIDTTEKEDVVVNDLIVNYRHATLPDMLSFKTDPVIKNKIQYVSKFYKALPSWLYRSSNTNMDIGNSLHALDLCNIPDEQVKPQRAKLCCKTHFLRSLYKHTPTGMIQYWSKMVSSYEADLEVEFFKFLIGEGNGQNFKFRWLPSTCRRKLTYAIPFKTKKKPPIQKEPLGRIPEENESETEPEENNKSIIVEISDIKIKHEQNNSKIEPQTKKENGISDTNKTGNTPKKKNSILEIVISENETLCLIRYKNLLCFVCHDLIKLFTDEPFEVVQRRLKNSTIDILKVTIRSDPTFYSKLYQYSQRKEYHLIESKSVEAYVKMVLPSSHKLEDAYRKMLWKLELGLMKKINMYELKLL